MAFVKTTWIPNSLPALDATQLNRIEQGIADAHDYGVPTVKSVVGGAIPLDFTGLADDTAYELVVRGRLNAPNLANAPALYLAPNGSTAPGANGARSLVHRTYVSNADANIEDLARYGNDYAAVIGTMDYNQPGLLISRTTFFRSATDGVLVFTTDWTFHPFITYAELRIMGGGYVNVAATLAKITLTWGGNTGSFDTGAAVLRKIG